MAYTKEQLQGLAREAAMRHGVDPALFMGLVQQESAWNPNARSHVGAQGLTQIMPDTARDPGFGLQGLTPEQMKDPTQQLDFGARYLKTLLNRYDGDTDKALASYNWGMGNVDKFGIDPNRIPKETRDYLRKVRGYAEGFGGTGNPYEITPSTSDTGTSALGAYGYDGYNDLPGGDGPASSEVGSTIGADRSGLGGILSGAAKGFMAGGPLGMAGGALVGAVNNMTGGSIANALGVNPGNVMGAAVNGIATGNPMGALGGLVSTGLQNKAKDAVGIGPSAAEVDDDGFGFNDAVSAGLKGFMAGGPIGALTGVAAGYAKNALAPSVDRVKDQIATGLGFTGANAASAGVPSNDPLSRALASAGLYGNPNPYSGTTGVAGNDDLSAALNKAISGGGRSTGGGSYSGGLGSQHDASTRDNHGGARGW